MVLLTEKLSEEANRKWHMGEWIGQTDVT